MRRACLISLIALFLLSLAATPRHGVLPLRHAPATACSDSLVTPPTDSLPDSLAAPPLWPDTVVSLGAGSLEVADSLTTDSTARKKPGIDSPVTYSSTDSLIYDAETGYAHLFGDAKVLYQNMDLAAARITMHMDSSLVHASGARDTAEVLTGIPIFKQGKDQYESDRISLNFKTKRGFIHNVSTTEGNGFLVSGQSKRTEDGTMYLQSAKYTTCDAAHPHFYLSLTRAKVHPGKDIVFGPAYLVVEDVPLPIAIPYGFFPFNKSYSSGFIMPSYGDETSRGFYLRDGGYYFALSDHYDLKLLGEIYTKGSWGLSAEMNYNKRYHYRGNFYVSYLTTVEGDKNMPDYMKTKSLKVQWTHSKDTKANPNVSFSARVNFASENYERKNLESLYNPLSYSQSTRASSVSFSRTFPSLGLTISGSGNITQNMRDSSLAVTLPDLSIQLNRIYPFRRKHFSGRERWYEKISVSYTGQISNSITTKEDRLLHSNLAKDWRNGMQHRIPIDATFQVLKYINLTASFNFHDVMYLRREKRSWDAVGQRELCDTTYGFYNLYDWNTALSANTTLYGFYIPSRKIFGDKVQAIRHVFKPSVSVSYAPDFTTAHYGYMDSYVRTDADGTVSTVQYSPYQGGIYGYPSGTKQAMLNFSVSNNLEMKVKSDRDSTGVRKVSIIDELSASMSYNMAAKVRPWSDLAMRLRLRLTKSYTFSLAANFATYAYEFDPNGNVVVGERTEYSHGRFGRFQGMSQNISYTLNNEKLKRLWDKLCGRATDTPTATDTNDEMDAYYDEDEANLDPDLQRGRQEQTPKKAATVDEDGYLVFSMPWSITFSYGVTMREDRSKKINERRMRYPYSFTQTLNFSGNLRIAQGWNIAFTSGYDFNYHDLSMTTISLSRNLHCFEMSASIVLRPFTSYNFTFRARASELADAIKWDKRSSYSTNIDWY